MAELKPKITLKQKGDKAAIAVKNLHATLTWTAAVDLDFHAYYKTKMTGPPEEKKGFFGKLFSGPQFKPGGEGLVYFADRGNKTAFPWIYLDQDAGVGDVGGKNVENLYFTDLQYIDHILIVANIFNKPNANFASYDGVVTVNTGDQAIDVPLTATTGGSYCIIAHIDNSAPTGPVLINVNKVQGAQPTIGSFLSGD